MSLPGWGGGGRVDALSDGRKVVFPMYGNFSTQQASATTTPSSSCPSSSVATSLGSSKNAIPITVTRLPSFLKTTTTSSLSSGHSSSKPSVTPLLGRSLAKNSVVPESSSASNISLISGVGIGKPSGPTIVAATGNYHVGEAERRRLLGHRHETPSQPQNLSGETQVLTDKDLVGDGDYQHQNGWDADYITTGEVAARPLSELLEYQDHIDWERITTCHDHEIFLNGEICIVDGLPILVRDGVIQVDCPKCNKSVGLAFLGSHLEMDHGTSKLSKCIVSSCDIINISTATVASHFLTSHCAFNCDKCSRIVFAHEIGEHLRSKCERMVSSGRRSLPKDMKLPRPIAGAVEKGADAVADFCPYCCKYVRRLNFHLKQVHEFKVKCQACKEWVLRSEYKNHRRNHCHEKNRPVKCIICRLRVSRLKQHFRRYHRMTAIDSDVTYNDFYRRGKPAGCVIKLKRID